MIVDSRISRLTRPPASFSRSATSLAPSRWRVFQLLAHARHRHRHHCRRAVNTAHIEIINQCEVKIDKKMIAKYLRCSLIFIRHSAIGWSIGTFIYYLYQFSALLSSLYKQQMRHSITSWTFLVSPLFSFVYL
jgi:hypothetical protein